MILLAGLGITHTTTKIQSSITKYSMPSNNGIALIVINYCPNPLHCAKSRIKEFELCLVGTTFTPFHGNGVGKIIEKPLDENLEAFSYFYLNRNHAFTEYNIIKNPYWNHNIITFSSRWKMSIHY